MSTHDAFTLAYRNVTFSCLVRKEKEWKKKKKVVPSKFTIWVASVSHWLQTVSLMFQCHVPCNDACFIGKVDMLTVKIFCLWLHLVLVMKLCIKQPGIRLQVINQLVTHLRFHLVTSLSLQKSKEIMCKFSNVYTNIYSIRNQLLTHIYYRPTWYLLSSV